MPRGKLYEHFPHSELLYFFGINPTAAQLAELRESVVVSNMKQLIDDEEKRRRIEATRERRRIEGSSSGAQEDKDTQLVMDWANRMRETADANFKAITDQAIVIGDDLFERISKAVTKDDFTRIFRDIWGRLPGNASDTTPKGHYQSNLAVCALAALFDKFVSRHRGQRGVHEMFFAVTVQELPPGKGKAPPGHETLEQWITAAAAFSNLRETFHALQYVQYSFKHWKERRTKLVKQLKQPSGSAIRLKLLVAGDPTPEDYERLNRFEQDHGLQ